MGTLMSDGPNKRAMDMYGKLIHYETLAEKSQKIFGKTFF